MKDYTYWVLYITTKSTHPLPTHVWLVIIENTAQLTNKFNNSKEIKKVKNGIRKHLEANIKQL